MHMEVGSKWLRNAEEQKVRMSSKARCTLWLFLCQPHLFHNVPQAGLSWMRVGFAEDPVSSIFWLLQHKHQSLWLDRWTLLIYTLKKIRENNEFDNLYICIIFIFFYIYLKYYINFNMNFFIYIILIYLLLIFILFFISY